MVEVAGCVLDDATTLTTTDQHHLDFLASRCRGIPLLAHAAAAKRRERDLLRRSPTLLYCCYFFAAAPEASKTEQGQTTMEEQAPFVA
jgi:hypothetical protein